MIKIIEDQLKNIKISGDVKTLIQWMKYEDMTCKQAAFLLLVQDNPGCTVGTLAAALGTNKPSITRACIKLETLGFVQRETDMADQRLVRIYATDKPL
jgi:DNA-binding MarR family transcriptional regulator